MEMDERIADIALFFYKGAGNEEVASWIPEKMYTDPEYLLCATPDEWLGATIAQVGQEPYYVTNLANLDRPGSPPTPDETANMEAVANEKQSKKSFKEVAKAVGEGDLLIIPFSEPYNVYRIPKAVYTNPKAVDEVKKAKASDLHYMADGEGVVLANVPKVSLDGLSCYLLNLRAMRKPRAPRQ